MKTLNQYIKESLLCKAIYNESLRSKAIYNESLLDDEDDLVNNSPIEIIKKFIKDNYKVSGKLDIKESNNIYIVNCRGNVEVSNIKIKQLTNGFFKWGKVGWDFDCSKCSSLTSLTGAPEKVGGDFYCYECESLKDLTGAPKKVGGGFYCYECALLKSLQGAPKEVDGCFDCSKCKSLPSLQGAPEKVGGYFYCYGCGAQFTKEDIEKVSKVKEKIFV